MTVPRCRKLIPFAKIDDAQALRIVQGFACAETLPEITAATNASQRTCRSIILALRPRLLRQPFDQWREAGLMRVIRDLNLESLAEAIVYGCMAKCYFKRDCYKNFRRGRRRTRDCRSCPIKALEMGEDYLAAALQHIDLIETFYFAQGLGVEREIGRLTQFRLRLVHTQVIGEAYEASRKLPDGSPDFADTRQGTARDLYDRLLREIRTAPLDRTPRLVYPDHPELEDLTWLDATDD